MLDIDAMLDNWMTILHGEPHPEAHLLRLATLGFAGSLPLTLSNDLKAYPEGHTGVTVRVGGRVEEDTPPDFEPTNLLERLLVSTPASKTRRISIPKRFNMRDLLNGMAVMPHLARTYLNAEMMVLQEGKGLRLDLYSIPLKRNVSVFLSED